MPLNNVTAKEIHTTLRGELLQLYKKYGDQHNLTPAEILAIAAHTVGGILALQNPQRISPHDAMQLVLKNIEQGNKEMVRAFQPQGSA